MPDPKTINFKIVRYLKASNLSSSSKVGLLVLFCLLSGSISFQVAKRSFSGQQRLSFSVSPIQTPGNIGKDAVERTGIFQIHQDEYGRIQLFKRYLDSLSRVPGGKQTYDSLLLARPGLIDSIFILENFYQSQTNYLFNGKSNQ